MRLVITASHSYTASFVPLTPGTPLTVSSPTAKTTIHFTPHPSRAGSTFSLTLSTIFSRSIPTQQITWGNDFDKPVRDYLPPKWKWALGIVRWVADPGLEEGLEEDKPWVRGPAVGSFNRVHIASSSSENNDRWKIGEPVEESWEGLRAEDQDFGAGGITKADFEALRGIKGDDDGTLKHRRAWFHYGKKDHGGKQKGVVLPAGRDVRWEFFNGFLDLEKFALNLPGFQLNILNYWDGQPIRFVLKEVKEDGSDGEVFAVISFTLVKEEEDDDDSEDDSDDSGEYEDAESGNEESKHVDGKAEVKEVKGGAGKTADAKNGPVPEDESELD